MKLILFDLDGTLIKAGHPGSRALNYAILHITGQEEICSKVDINGTTDMMNFTEAYRVATGNMPDEDQIREITDRYLARLPHEVEYSVKNGQYEVVKGAEAFLKMLSSRKDVLVGLGTGNIERGAFIKLGPSGLGRYFPYGGYGEDSHDRARMLKTGVTRGCYLADISPASAEVYIIGDTHKDILAARANGYHCAIVSDGFGNSEKIQQAKPDFIQPDYTNTKAWLEWLGLV